MFGRVLVGAPALVLLLSAALRAQAPSVSLREATTRALANHPDLRAAEADLAIANGELRTARTLAYNPALFASAGPATRGDTSVTNYQVGVSHAFELGGKRAARRDAAQLRVEAAEARRERIRANVAWRVQRSFYLALVARERLTVATEADSVAVALRTAAQDRLTLGEATQLELNVAAASAARDRRRRLDAERELASALIEFGAALGSPAGDTVVPAGAVPRFAAVPIRPDSFVAFALTRRSDLAALRAERGAASANLRFARALWWPDPEIGISTGREEDLRVTQFAISLPLPLWNRGQGQRAAASGAIDRTRVAEDSAERAVEREVLDAHQSLRSALASLDAFDRDVVERLSENLALARESFDAGKISFYTYNTIRRDLVEARLEYLEALAETVNRRYALALAVGEPWE